MVMVIVTVPGDKRTGEEVAVVRVLDWSGVGGDGDGDGDGDDGCSR